MATEPSKNPSAHVEVERVVYYAQRPDFRIVELHLTPRQHIPWHRHTAVQDTFYVLHGGLRLFLRDPTEEVRLAPGETYAVAPRRPHLVTNAGEESVVFLVLQAGAYDFIPLP